MTATDFVTVKQSDLTMFEIQVTDASVTPAGRYVVNYKAGLVGESYEEMANNPEQTF